ncbi:MAG: DUF4012 domain-containing protein [Anaerolineales bacterium]|nr:DUF4012 domain-containing protein [Anaerolineales bacterium]MCB8951599.1 DUF4012 domain-containing protein [Ardenticatenales bacterium]
MPNADRPSSPRRSRLPLLLTLAGLLLLLAWLGLKGWRIYRAAVSLQTRQQEATTLLAAGLTNLDPNAAEALVMGARADVVILTRETRIFHPLMPHLGWVPRLGPTLVAAPHLLEMADAATAAAAYAFRGLKPGLNLLRNGNSGNDLLAALPTLLAQAGPDLGQATAELDRVATAYAQIENRDALPWQLRQYLPLLDEWLPIARDGLRLAQSAPALLGGDGPRRYLIVAQNEDELRPTGGFISGVGLLTLQDGRIDGLQFDDANVVDDWAHKPYDWPPEPLHQFMASDLFLFRDANFWPDFPTSATAMMDLYTYGQGVPLDGIVATDQRFLQMLLGAIGPVTLPELDATVSNENVLEWIKQAWQPTAADEDLGAWMRSRKSFMGPLAAAMQAKVLQNPGELDFVRLARTMMEAIATKHLLIFVRDAAAASALAEMGWDGRLPTNPDGDLLLVADTNVGFNKANALVDSEMVYEVLLDAAGGGSATLTVRYRHKGNGSEADCIHQTVYTADITYDRLRNDCYWDYARVYAPTGATLLAGTSAPVAAGYFVSGQPWAGQVQSIADPSGLTTFANFLLLRRGESAEQTYAYALPVVTTMAADETRRYQLRWIKQPGTRPQDVQVRVTLPANTQPLTIIPNSGNVQDQTISFTARLNSDMTFTVIFR